MTKKILITMTSAALLSLGLLTGSNEVNAAVKVGQSNRLQRNAYIYNAQGHRTKKSTWKRGRKIIVLGTKTIKGKKYARVGKNQYIRLANFHKANVNSKPTAMLKHNAYVFDENGKRVKVASLKKNKLIAIRGTRYIKGKKYYQISKNRFIKATNVTTSTANETTDNRNNLNYESTNNTKTTNTVNNASSANSTVTNNVTNSEANAINTSSASLSINSNSGVNTNNSKSSTNTNKPGNLTNNPADISDDQEKDLKLLHTSYVFDKTGKHILGKYVVKGNILYVKGKISIDGKPYYGLMGDDDENVVGYIPVSAFEPNGTDLKGATDKEFIQYKKDINQLYSSVNNNSILDLATSAKRTAYFNAADVAETVGNFKYSTIEDMKEAKAKLQQAIQNLDGKPIVVEGSYDNYTLTDAQKSQILTLVNRKYDTNDARFDPDGKYVIYTNQYEQRETTDIRPFIKFENKQSFNPAQYLGSQVVKHNSYGYNSKGNRVLGEFISKGDKIQVSSYLKINGKLYYGFYKSNGSPSECLLPIDALEENGKDEKFEPASKKQFDDFFKFERDMNGKVYEHDLYELSSPTAKADYQNAADVASRVADDDRSSQQDIETAEKQMKTAFSKLDGKKIQIEGKRKGHKYTESEINKIIALIAKVRGFKKIEYAGMSGDDIKYVVNHKNQVYDTRFLVHFSDDSAWN